MEKEYFIEYSFSLKPVQPYSDILVAELSELGFDSFVENEDGLLAYIEADSWHKDILSGIHILKQAAAGINYNYKRVAQQNWNAKWEADFHPIELGDLCRVRAPFHEKKDVKYDIEIAPKMSFGTGHHETTYMMLQWALEVDFDGLSVLDMGCGTGVLAIIAAMKGAAEIDAIDIDSWSYENARENAERNGQEHIRVLHGDAELLGEKLYDLIFANINKNILLQDIPVYASCLKENGILLLSGFYKEDLDDITGRCAEFGLNHQKNILKNNWVSAKYVI
ncbi:50S ribosomal protein L11 methyltransferase [Zeaxanthinibacter enoshimensis]|uniref:Ribosomal protein L11 methyltransferase n=1 Tax=Zeaxanthinibacter enoshimensis TaxID=392009 RepID=A0A4V3D3D3_9FLAO|nr:50S ribosomal protein L11 methyltransferase [Zeaxanthinibacter enoshimensis]TDQ29134.1 ribosomal protein L11 methyltransferase [Zeaxanthinibacter enoshimensis]